MHSDYDAPETVFPSTLQKVNIPSRDYAIPIIKSHAVQEELSADHRELDLNIGSHPNIAYGALIQKKKPPIVPRKKI